MPSSPMKSQSTIERVHANIAKYRRLAATSAAFHEFPLVGGRILIITPTRIHAMEDATYDELCFLPSHCQSSPASSVQSACRSPAFLASMNVSHATTPSWPKSEPPSAFVSDAITLMRGEPQSIEGAVSTLAIRDVVTARCSGSELEIRMAHTTKVDTSQFHSRLPTAGLKPLFGGTFRTRLVNAADGATIEKLLEGYRSPFEDSSCRKMSALERAATFVESWDSALPQRPRPQFLGSDVEASPAPSTFVGDCVQIAKACRPLEL